MASITATYTSPTTDPLTFTRTLASSTDKTAQLTSLLEAVSSIQNDINKELTARMEEEKTRDASAANGTSAIDEAKEEENYGEEVQEEED